MTTVREPWRNLAGRVLLAMVVALVAGLPSAAAGQSVAAEEVTFSRDIAPILQRSCQKCHRPDSLAPMSLIDYDEARPWARAMKFRTGLRDKQGVMPPWYIEKNIGIQRFKDDPSLNDEEIAMIAAWADSGAPRGDPADLILSSPTVEVAADQPEGGDRSARCRRG